MRANTVLAHLAAHPGQAPSAIARAIGGTNPRAVQRVLARLRESDPPLVRAVGDVGDRAYYLTEAGAAAVRDAAPVAEDFPPEPTPPPTSGDRGPAPTVERDVLRRVSALLTTARIPTTDAGRVIPLEERVRRLIAERDAADTRIDDELRRKALGAFASDPRLRYLASVVPADALLRAVVEAGIEALHGAAPRPNRDGATPEGHDGHKRG